MLLVHGFAQNRYSWHLSTRSFSAWLAAQGYDVWNVELRGHGRSRLQEGQNLSCGFQDYVDDMLRLSQALPEPAFWIGHSMGGAVSYATAASKQPPRCRGIIGIGAVFHFARGNPSFYTLCKLSHSLLRRLPVSLIRLHTHQAGNLLAKIHGITDVLGYTFPLSGWWPGTIGRGSSSRRVGNTA